MTLIRKLASVLLLASWLISGSINSQELVAGQIYNTQNLINSSTSASSTTGTWQNVGSWNQGLPCWGPGGPVYCGPQPYFNNGSVNFSYGMTDLNQVVNIANALPNTGTGLRVNGFNFGFTAKNGNGWDNGQQDYLAAYVTIYGADGKQVQSYDYSAYTNRKYDWTTFNFSETFTTPYATKDLGTARYGFVGYDTNFWAGPYGPEIYNINFSLKYSVDPCVKDPLYSPTCPGYLSALNKLTGTSSTSTTETPTVTTATSSYQAGAVSEDLLSKVAENNRIASAVSSDLLSKVLESNKNSASVSTASITAATNLNDKSSITAFALSVIAKNADMEKSIQNKAVSDAIADANAAASAAVEQSQAVAASQSQASINSANRLPGATPATSAPLQGSTSASSGQGLTLNNNNTPQPVAVLLPPTMAPTVDSGNSYNSNSASTRVSAITNVAPVPAPTVTTNSFELLPPAPIVQQTENSGQGLNVRSTSTSFASSTFVSPAPVTTISKLGDSESNRSIDLSSPTDFVAGYVNTKHTSNDAQPIVSGPAVNNKAKDNDAAGSVSIASIAKMPPGYDLYTSLTLKDVTFYKPEELYKGQKTVDNMRLLRGLTGASDRVHQEMVDSQYNKK